MPSYHQRPQPEKKNRARLSSYVVLILAIVIAVVLLKTVGTKDPIKAPAVAPTATPTVTAEVTAAQTEAPTIAPTAAPTATAAPTQAPTTAPTATVAPTKAPAAQSGDLVIPLKDITEKASFYPMKVDGTKLEVLAVKAPDGTIRTAFNTCQVCYSSGRGYYKQQGDVLVCQNCGNRFKASDVEVSKGGCNPVPILEGDKTVDENNITIPASLLKQAVVIFSNWKTN
jgi:uncharacterized Zn ribbon protein